MPASHRGVRLLKWGGSLLLLLIALIHLVWFLSRPSASDGDPSPPQQSVAPLAIRTRLVQQVAADDPEQLLDRLTEKYDDIALASISAPFGYQATTYAYAQAVVPKLTRVRRMIQEHQHGHRFSIEKIESLLAGAVKGYGAVYDRVCRLQRERGERNVPSTAPFPEWDDWTRRQVNAQVSVYLLAEFKSYGSLPLLARVYSQQELSPVSRLFVFYAMHVLAWQHPKDGLSQEAVDALNVYLRRTAKVVPSPALVSVPAWKAPVTETDFRATVVGEDVGLDGVEKVELHEYPESLNQYEDPLLTTKENNFGLAPEVLQWSAQLQQFVRLAHPGTAESKRE